MEDPGERCLSKHPSHRACIIGDARPQRLKLDLFQRFVYVCFWVQLTITNPSATSPGVTTTLGRPIATPGGITFPLLSQTASGEWSNRVNQVDFRVTKIIPIKEHARLELMVDLYNLFNVNPVLTRTVTVAKGYYAPATVLQANFVKLGARFTF